MFSALKFPRKLPGRGLALAAALLLSACNTMTSGSGPSIKAGAPFIDPQGRLKVQSIYDQVAWMQSQGLVGKDVDPASFVDLSFVEGHLDVPSN